MPLESYVRGPSPLHTLAIIPSSYALATWALTLSIAPFAPQPINDISFMGALIISYALFCFLFSISITYLYARRSVIGARIPDLDQVVIAIFTLCSIIGIYGLVQYISNILPYAGGIDGLLYIIVSQDFLAIRAYSSEISTIGFQLSYFSWLGIYLGIMIVMRAKNLASAKLFVLAVVIIQIIGNLLFVDRTRPMWIGLPILVAIWFGRNYVQVKIYKVILYLIALPIGFFFLFTLITGKFSQYGALDNFFIYATGGYGYLDSLVVESRPVDMLPLRTAYWVSKFIELAGVDITVPDQILDFRYVPFQTNVGTFIEPLISDGGLLFVFTLIPIIVIGLDRLAVMMFNRNTYLGLFIWGNIIFCSSISFFVPKFNQLPIWLFLAIALIGDGVRRYALRTTTASNARLQSERLPQA